MVKGQLTRQRSGLPFRGLLACTKARLACLSHRNRGEKKTYNSAAEVITANATGVATLLQSSRGFGGRRGQGKAEESSGNDSELHCEGWVWELVQLNWFDVLGDG